MLYWDMESICILIESLEIFTVFVFSKICVKRTLSICDWKLSLWSDDYKFLFTLVPPVKTWLLMEYVLKDVTSFRMKNCEYM